MKILHVTPNIKWAKIFIEPIAYEQSKKGNTILISSPEKNENFTEELEYVSYNEKLKSYKKYLLSLRRLTKFIRENDINDVYFHTFLDSFLYIIICRLFTKARINYINHGVPYIGYKGMLGIIFKFMEMCNIIFSHRIFSITKGMTPFLEKINILNKKIITFKPGTIAGIKNLSCSYDELLKTREYKKITNNNKIKILFVGRIEKRKGIYDLIEAIISSKLDIELTIAGSGSLSQEILDYPQIRNVGYLDDLTNIYLENDFLCVPSYHEGFGQVYLEAAKFGVIPICSDIPGPTDFVHDKVNGFVVNPHSPNSILELLYEINAEKYDIEKIRENAFNSVKIYEQSRVLRLNMELIE